MKVRKIPIIVEATQWWKNGDHPEDNCKSVYMGGEQYVQSDGSIVGRYRRSPEQRCQYCGVKLCDHGWIKTLEGGHIVCPGDWIITLDDGEHYPCKPDVFDATYEAVDES